MSITNLMWPRVKARLEERIENLKADAATGDRGAEEVVRLYRQHCRCPNDPDVLVAEFEDWEKAKRKRSVL
jgi:hypothetical protein